MKLSYLAMTSYEGPAPDMEIWPAAPSYCRPDTARQSVSNTLQQALYAEALGFDWVSVSEHHYAPYMMTPNPVVMAAALSQVVKKAGIALLGPLVPLNNPIRLAEEIAMLDNLTGGRVSVLFLRGTPNEFNTYDTPAENTRGMTQEGIDLILKAWREEEPFSWHGEHYNFSTVSVWPRLQQLPHPPLYGSGNSEESVVFAASRRMGIAFSFAPPKVVEKWVSLYRQEAARFGWEPTAEHVLYRGLTHVDESDARAVEGMESHFGAKAEEQALLQSKTMGGPPKVPLVAKPYFLGGATTVIGQFEALRDCGVGVVDMCFSIGDGTKQREAMRLVSEKIMPTVREGFVARTPSKKIVG